MNRPIGRGLNAAERRALEPVGPPGEYVSNEVLAGLIRDHRGRWVAASPGVEEFEPTEFGLMALRLCPRE